MIALGIGQPEQPLLEDRIALVPQRDAEAKEKMLVAKAADPVLAPAIGPAARVIVREIRPGIAIGAVILAHRPPLAIADIGPPASPRRAAPGFLEPAAFFGLRDALRGSAAASNHLLPPELPPRRQFDRALRVGEGQDRMDGSKWFDAAAEPRKASR